MPRNPRADRRRESAGKSDRAIFEPTPRDISAYRRDVPSRSWLFFPLFYAFFFRFSFPADEALKKALFIRYKEYDQLRRRKKSEGGGGEKRREGEKKTQQGG